MTAVEVMPIATFPGNRGWGYDGVYSFAPHPAYGGPQGFARFVDAAHASRPRRDPRRRLQPRRPRHRALRAFGPYFTDRLRDALGRRRSTTRSAGCASGRSRTPSCGCATTASTACGSTRCTRSSTTRRRTSSPSCAERVKAIDPRVLVIAEIETGDLRPIEEWGHDAQWADELHHELHVLLTGEREGYYAELRLGRRRSRASSSGGRPSGSSSARRTTTRSATARSATGLPPDALRVARGVRALLAPQVPLLFMGEEYGEQRRSSSSPTTSTRSSPTRRARAAGASSRRFAGFSGEDVPDPQDPETFERSKLDPPRGDPELRASTRELLRLRRELPREVETEVDGPRLRLRRGAATSSSPTSTRADASRCALPSEVWPGSRSRSGRPGTATGRTSRSSPSTPSASSSACSTSDGSETRDRR